MSLLSALETKETAPSARVLPSQGWAPDPAPPWIRACLYTSKHAHTLTNARTHKHIYPRTHRHGRLNTLHLAQCAMNTLHTFVHTPTAPHTLTRTHAYQAAFELTGTTLVVVLVARHEWPIPLHHPLQRFTATIAGSSCNGPELIL